MSSPGILFGIPGRGETLAESFGGIPRGPKTVLTGLEWARDLEGLRFSAQVDLVTHEVRTRCWDEAAMVVARSFGAWILVNALLEMPEPHPGTVLCVSSVLGYGSTGGVNFIAPRALRFWREAPRLARPPAREFSLLHASDDTQCPLAYAEKLHALWGGNLIVRSGGHSLGKGPGGGPGPQAR